MSFFTSDAVAAAAPPEGNPYTLVIMLLVFGLIFYFMILRPQQKRSKEHKKLMDSISKGDEIMTTGGLVGQRHESGGNWLCDDRAEQHYGSSG